MRQASEQMSRPSVLETAPRRPELAPRINLALGIKIPQANQRRENGGDYHGMNLPHYSMHPSAERISKYLACSFALARRCRAFIYLCSPRSNSVWCSSVAVSKRGKLNGPA